MNKTDCTRLKPVSDRVTCWLARATGISNHMSTGLCYTAGKMCDVEVLNFAVLYVISIIYNENIIMNYC